MGGRWGGLHLSCIQPDYAEHFFFLNTATSATVTTTYTFEKYYYY